MTLTAQVAETIEQHQLMPSGASVLVAVSGGPDSVALLHRLRQLNAPIEAAHLNHQFRGDESDGDADFVATLCESLGIHLTTTAIDVPSLTKAMSVSAQQAARVARYDFLERVRADRGLDLIATAHNLDDRIETILLNIMRGTGVDGLRGIPYRRGPIIRPLLDTSRPAIMAYLEEHKLLARSDSSNLLSKYARNNVRSELLPYLERRFNPSVRSSLLRLSEIATDESDFLNRTAVDWIDGRITLPVDQLTAQPVALLRRILREWIRARVSTELADVSHILVEQLRKGLTQPCAVTIPGGKFVVESNGEFVTIRELATVPVTIVDEIPVVVDSELLFGDYLVNVVALGCNVDEGSLIVRSWRDGDRITLSGGTRKVQDIFTDQKIPRALRHVYPILADKFGLVAVGSIRYAVRAVGTVVSVVKVD
jgi:tRNA(Ile)-lysidine synthase